MLEIRALRAEDIAGGRRLSDQAGWNHLDADWLRLISLWPETCIAGWLGDTLVATATLAMFNGATDPAEHLAWIGVMLVDQEQRGKGFGGMMFDAVLQLGLDRGISNFGLDATDMGRPLYAKRGFQDLFVMHRWKCASPVVGPVDLELPRGVRPLEDWDWEAVQSLDRQMAGVDRTALLEWMAGEEGVTTLVAEEGGEITGYGMLRPGRVAAYIGPVVATDAASGAAIFKGLMGSCADANVPVFIDTATEPVLEPALIEEGFAIARTLTRMGRVNGDVRGHRMAYSEGIFAIAGLELC